MSVNPARTQILVIAPEPNALTQSLHEIGFSAARADTLSKALELIPQCQPDLILVEPGLAGPDLPDAVQRLRNKAAPEQPLLIGWSPTPLESDATGDMAAEMDGHLPGPPTAQALLACVAGFLRQKRLMDDLRSSASRFRRMADDSGDGILVMDSDQHIRYSNPVASALLERHADAILRSLGDPASHPTGNTVLDLSVAEGRPLVLEGRPSPVEWDHGRAWLISLRDITAHKETEHALELTQFAVGRAADGVAWLHPDGSHYYANDALCELTGYSREELLTLTVFDVNPAFPPTAWPEHWETLKKMGSQTFESTVKRKDGTLLPVEVAANHIAFDGREYNCAYIRDISERRRTENRLKTRASQQATIAALSREALTGVSVARLKDRAVRLVADVFDIEYCKVLELQPDGKTLKLVAGVGWSADPVGQATLPATTEFQAGYTLRTEEPVIVADLATETRFKGPPLLHDHGVVSGISVAIPGDSGPRGVLGAHASQPRIFTADDVDFFHSVANILAEAFRRAEMDEALRRNEMLLEVAGRTARLGGWVVDLKNDLIVWSDETCAIHELPPGTRLPISEGIGYYAPEWRDHVAEVFWSCARDGAPFDEEWPLITAAGRRVWVRAIGEPVRDDSGGIVQVRGAIQDITERKEMEAEAKQLAERLTDTLESITDAFFTLDREWRFTFLNQEAQRLLGRSRESLLGRPIWEEFPEALDTVFEQEYRRAVAENTAVEFDTFYPPLGTWLEVRAYPSDEGLAVYFHDITDRKQAEEEINFLALYDPLTQLPNRQLFQDRLSLALTASLRDRYRGAVLLLDLDHFKNLNEGLGHQTGDLLLQHVASRLQGILRKSDTVARFGGDEFVIILEDLSFDRDEAALQANAVAQKIIWALNAPYQLAGRSRQVTPSIGIALFGDESDTADELLKRADVAMYQAKAAGRNTARQFNQEMQSAVSHRVEVETEIRDALQRNEFVPYYQPQVDDAGRVIGAEALVRWRHPKRGAIPPRDFIPIAEETDLIRSIGTTMLESVCQQLARWAERPDTARLPVSVNLSAREFHNPDFVTQVMEIVHRTGANPACLQLELTETLLLADVEDTITKMTALKAHGIGFSLDDFGTGYSSLYYVKHLPLDQLKIDQHFVRDVLTDANAAAILRAIVVLAQNLELGVVAEGVETEAVRDFLADQGCTNYQGYLFSYPLPVADLEEFLKRRS